jgi:hypothetical protein
MTAGRGSKRTQSTGRRKGKTSMPQYTRTSITMPVSVSEEIERRRGNESFSGHIVLDLNAYWDAVRLGMHKLRNRFNKQEACHLAATIDARRWGAQRLDGIVIPEIVFTIQNSDRTNKYGVDIDKLAEKLRELDLIELLALLNWSRTGRQKDETPEESASYFD